MAHFRLQQMAFYLGGGYYPTPPHGQIIGCRVEISLDPHEKKPVQWIFVGGWVLLLYFNIGRVSGSGSRFSRSLSLLWNLEPVGTGKGIVPIKKNPWRVFLNKSKELAGSDPWISEPFHHISPCQNIPNLHNKIL